MNHPDEEIDLPTLIDRRMKAPIEQIETAIEGEISDEQAENLESSKLTMTQSLFVRTIYKNLSLN